MSLETWKKQYYPTGTAKLAATLAKQQLDPLDAAIKTTEHSLRKWEGLRPPVLEKHKLVNDEAELMSRSDAALVKAGGFPRGDRLVIDVSSCALCWRYRNRDVGCDKCPIKLATNEPCFSQYVTFCDTGNPGPMIRLLGRVLRGLQRQLAARKAKTPKTTKKPKAFKRKAKT